MVKHQVYVRGKRYVYHYCTYVEIHNIIHVKLIIKASLQPGCPPPLSEGHPDYNHGYTTQQHSVLSYQATKTTLSFIFVRLDIISGNLIGLCNLLIGLV